MSDFLKGLGSALGGVTSLLSGGALIDAAGNALGLPPAITHAAKVAVGAMTGNVLLAADGAMGLAQELTKNPPATTEYTPPADSARACEGYASPPARGCSPAETSGPAQACGGTQGSHLDPKMNDYFHALQTLQQNFRYLDATDGKLDGHLSRGDLKRISEDARVSPGLRQAARFLVDNPGYFERLDNTGGPRQGASNDDRFTPHGLQNELNTVRADFARYGQPAGTGGPAPSGSTSGTASSSMKGIINDPSMSLEEKIEAILMALTEKMDGEILQTMDALAAAQDKQAGIKNGKGDEKALADSQRDIDRLNLRLQKLVEKRKMMFEMMSTLSMKFNEMAKTALSNMRSA
ncbi:hypothetical protein ATI61_105311 [Archangium gephyra]|nr:hypothetical protein [Archangium gephyra]REG31984.1 hypothetical protein ATI61_105311 [Archangium gephyra]